MGGGVGLEDVVLQPACAAPGCVRLQAGRDQRSDPAPARVRVDVALDLPRLAVLAHRAVADDALALPDDPHVLLEVEIGPLALEVGLGEGAGAVQRRLDRRDDFGHRCRVAGDRACEAGVLHAVLSTPRRTARAARRDRRAAGCCRARRARQRRRRTCRASPRRRRGRAGAMACARRARSVASATRPAAPSAPRRSSATSVWGSITAFDGPWPTPGEARERL